MNSPGRVIKLGISIFYCGWLALKDAVRLLTATRKPRCVVLYYHSFLPGSGPQFGKQLDLVRRRTTAVGAGAVLSEPGRYAAITIDDGFQNVVDIALPELERRNLPATIFMIADGFGKCLDWSDEFYDWYRTQRIMTEETMCGLPPDRVTIGSHSLTHPMLTKLASSDAEKEIRESKRKLEKLLGRPVTLFSFPHGECNGALVQMCREAGYERVFTTDPAFTKLSRKEFVVGRVTVEPTDWPIEFRLKLRGAYGWLPKAIAVKRKLRRRRTGEPKANHPPREQSLEHAAARDSNHR
jgi:peptidoglycan/xylan/chitin deacetylase (PgdA/CDA1 family)